MSDKAARALALQRMRAAKNAGISRVDQLAAEVEPEEDIFREVDEEEYSDIVRQRREQQFVVDDEEGDYHDTGEEWFDEGSGKKDRRSKSGPRKTGALNVPARARKVDTVAQNQRIERVSLRVSKHCLFSCGLSTLSDLIVSDDAGGARHCRKKSG